MRKYEELLDVVNEDDEIIRQEQRNIIHEQGLLHREVWVWIYDDDMNILFQKRAPDKDTFPNKLDASVGGHVDPGYSYEDAAIKELEEETGIRAEKKDLKFIKMMRSSHSNPGRHVNNVIRAVYAYKFIKDKDSLKLEKGKATSLEFWPIKKLLNLSDDEKRLFIPFKWEEEIYPQFEKIANLI